jgi:hypothetical protein
MKFRIISIGAQRYAYGGGFQQYYFCENHVAYLFIVDGMRAVGGIKHSVWHGVRGGGRCMPGGRFIYFGNPTSQERSYLRAKLEEL